MATFISGANALSYKYEIYTETGHGDSANAISGLLSGDYRAGTKWDTDAGTGADSTYSIKYYVKVGGTDINLETIDTTLSFNTTDLESSKSLFKDFSGATFKESASFNYGVSYSFTGDDSIRFTGAVGDEIGTTAEVDTSAGWTEMFTLSNVSLNKDEAVENLLSDISAVDSYTAKAGTIELSSSTNIYDTVLSDRGIDNAEIASLNELGYAAGAAETIYDTDKENKVTLHEAKSQFEDFGTNIYTQRRIGSDDTTSLVRKGSTVIAESYWTNVGTYSEEAKDVVLSSTDSTEVTVAAAYNASTLDSSVSGLYSSTSDAIIASSTNGTLLEGFEVQKSSIAGDNLDSSTADGYKLKFDVKIADTLTAGTVLSDLDFFSLTGANNDATNGTNDASKVSKTMVTFQGDVNYDGRVSLKDLAFLNAGALAATAAGASAEDYADVNADFIGGIDVNDLAVLSAEWGGTIQGSVSSADLLSGKTEWTSIDADLYNVQADIGTVSAIADINTAITYENSAFDYEDTVSSPGLAFPEVAVVDMVAGSIL